MPLLFPITIEVEEIATGRILRKLSAMEGIAKIHLNLTHQKSQQIEREDDNDIETSDDSMDGLRVTPSRSAGVAYRSDGRLNTRGLPHGQNPAYKLIASILLKTPAHIKILAAALARDSVGAPTAINGFIHRMTKFGLVTRTAPGTYRLTTKGIKVFGGKDYPRQVAGYRAPPSNGFYGVNNLAGARFLILTTLRDQEDGSMPIFDLNKVLVMKDFSPNNLSVTSRKMLSEGIIERVGMNYRITDTGREALVPSEPELPQLNHDQDNEGMTANG